MRLKKKILCTLGPSSLNPKVIRRLTEQQVDLFRLNLSHTPLDKLEEYFELIRSNSDLPICFDTQGAQVRTGDINGGNIYLKSGTLVGLVGAPKLSNKNQVSLYPSKVLKQLEIGDIISIDFDAVLLQIIKNQPNSKARVISSGKFGANKAVTVVGNTPKIPCLSELDRKAISMGKRLGIQYVALSFANCPSDVLELRKLLNDKIRIISKIESWAGVSNLNEILDVTDEILIDRGDLSREVVIENIPYIQKEIIKKSNKKNVPVNVATNLLESMIHSTMPTRAEVNDVVNTLNDGADGLVLAAETAIGKHPIACVSMIRSLIHRFENRIEFLSNEHLVSYSNLVEPHGGKLVQNILTDDMIENINELPRWNVDEYTMMDAEQIAVGTYSPLSGFMSKENLDSVLEVKRLVSGEIWTVPIIFQVRGLNKFTHTKAEKVVLCKDGEARAIIQIEDVYQYDLNKLSTQYFGTTNSAHPGAAYLLAGSKNFISGKVWLLKTALRKHKPYELTPSQSRLIFQHHKWARIVSFYANTNVPNLSHEYQQFAALENYDCDGLFINIVIGKDNASYFNSEKILSVYQELIEKHYPENKIVIGGFVNYLRYAGSREAVFNAICQKNFGCSHFIVNSDPNNTNNMYEHSDTVRLFEELGDFGIKPVFFNDIYFCYRCNEMTESCEHDSDSYAKFSDIDVKDNILHKRKFPDWFMRITVQQFLYNNENELTKH